MTDPVAALLSALNRTEDRFRLAVGGLPVRDMAETLAENRAARETALDSTLDGARLHLLARLRLSATQDALEAILTAVNEIAPTLTPEQGDKLRPALQEAAKALSPFGS